MSYREVKLSDLITDDGYVDIPNLGIKVKVED